MDSRDITREIAFEPGEFLIREKTPCKALYIIKEGQLEVYKTLSSGEKLPLGMISSGQYVGENALLMNTQNQSNVVALTPVRAIEISRELIETQLKQVPSWLVSMTKGLIVRLHFTNEILRRNGLVDERLADRIRAVEEKYKIDTFLEEDLPSKRRVKKSA